jgi:hypothetical protein
LEAWFFNHRQIIEIKRRIAMKKNLSVCFALALVLSALLTSTRPVTAAPLGGGPTISAPSGGGTVTLTVVPVSKLPGTEMNDVGTIFPQGHTNGDMMFSGEGVSVSGLVGYATLSMPLANYAAGWTGSIYQWLNESWVVLPTTITPNEEGPDAVASATIYSNGIFALITGYKLPDTGDKKCGYYFWSLRGGYYTYAIYFSGGDIAGPFGSLVPEGTTYRYRVINPNPDDEFIGDVTGLVVVTDSWYEDGMYGISFEIPDGAIVFSSEEVTNPPFIFRVFIDGCKVDFVIGGGGDGGGDGGDA